MNKNILFLVTGMTPQIITETIWALACDPDREDQWVPDEVHVMSTEHGLNQIRQRLIKEGHFQKLMTDYQLPNIIFNSATIHSINDANHNPLVDLKSPEENELAGDAICSKIREFTQQDNVSLHVSIAGGRKTMGFYAGYALSLYGRAQDQMSHVLVDERYEAAINFFYPSPNKNDFSLNRDHAVIGPSIEARIWLANIPFVRLKDAIKEKHQLNGNDSFTDVVSKINDSFNDVNLCINLDNNTVCINDKYEISNLPPREFALLHWFAEKRINNQMGIIAPAKNINSKDAKQKDIDYISTLSAEFRKYYDETSSDAIMVDKTFFDTVKSLLKKNLEANLGLELAAKVAITQEKKGTPFYLNLAPSSVKIWASF